MRRVSVLLSFVFLGCFRNLDFAPCQEDPSQAICQATDAAAEAADTAAGDTETDTTDTAKSCADGATDSEPCGNCGTRTRACMPDGTYGAWGACTGEGPCAPDATETVTSPACPGAFEERSRTCTKTCTWSETCSLKRGWSSISAAPALFEARKGHSIVWTGTELLIWGGQTKASAKRDGVRWSVATNTWKAMSSPPASILDRYDHSAVWTGSRMLIWGGQKFDLTYVGDGASYDPATDTWTVLPPAPIAGRRRAGTVWTGKQMIVWGGEDGVAFGAADGASFDPLANKWTKLPSAPINGRSEPQVVFDGKDMIVWGGANVDFETSGARFDPESLVWTKLSDSPLPARAYGCSAATSGGMFVYGGATPTGGDPILAAIPRGVVLDGLGWSETTTPPTAVTSIPERFASLCWCTSGKCFVWSGQTIDKVVGFKAVRDGFAYDLSSGAWTPMLSAGEPVPRAVASSVWTGKFAAVWGGDVDGSAVLRDGAIYVP
ncbi:MAG: Kelch repeat-containing protein [Polyangiales bacterium]